MLSQFCVHLGRVPISWLITKLLAKSINGFRT